MKRTILYYNWNSLDSSDGGGVNVYQKNIINTLKENKEYNIVVLSSGVFYDKSRKIYIKKINNKYNVDEYTIVNSPVLAPSKQSESNFKNYVEDEIITSTFIDFCKKIPNLSVIHFNNLEGISINCLKVKDELSNIKIIYSAHNYFSICPEVNLWNSGKCNCLNADNHDCRNCFIYPKRKMEISKRIYSNNIKNNKLKNISNKVIHLRYILEKNKKYDDNYYQLFLEKNIEMINKYCDCVVAVSKRVGEILIEKGINPSIIKINYIGNDFSLKKPTSCVADPKSDIFRIIYLGPMRRDKGFYFLIDALNKIPDSYKKSIEVTFASRFTDKNIFKEIDLLKKSFSDVIMIDGYKRDELEKILQNKNLGIVPILWEDNLPQVTIEMIASGVPVLCGSYGGAKEVANNKDFVFTSGSIDDFVNKFMNIYKNRKLLSKFYDHKLNLVTMDEHIDELLKIYNS